MQDLLGASGRESKSRGIREAPTRDLVDLIRHIVDHTKQNHYLRNAADQRSEKMALSITSDQIGCSSKIFNPCLQKSLNQEVVHKISFP